MAAMVRGADSVEMLARNWSSMDGLPQDHIRAIVRTHDGFLWLGTDAGLTRFDGRVFKTYGLRDGLAAVTVLSLMEASDGALWIGTLGGGVSVMRDGQVVKSFTQADGLPKGRTPTLAEDKNGRIWVAGSVWLEKARFVPVPGISGIKNSAFRQRNGVMWLTASDQRIDRWLDGKLEEGSGGGPVTSESICEDEAGRLWIADTSQRLWCWDQDRWSSWDIPAEMESRVSSICAAADGTVWLASFRSGVCGFRDGVFLTPKIEGEKFLDLAEYVLAGTDGLLWLGTSTNGLYSLTSRHVQFVTLGVAEATRGANFIGALVESTPGAFIVGTQGRGLFRWSEAGTAAVEEIGVLNRGLFGNCMVRTRDGTCWAGTTRGVFGILPQGGLAVPLMGSETINNAWELCDDRAGGLWVGTGSGLVYHFPGNAERVDFGLKGSGPIKGMALQSDGTLWIGTRGNGLYRLKDGISRRFGIADGLKSEVVRVIAATADGSLWVGTMGGGLSVFVGERFHSVTTEDGLPDDIISQVTMDGRGRLWLGCNRGIAVLEKHDVDRVKAGVTAALHPLVINRADGLLSEECTIVPPVHMHDGQLAFATTNGFAILRPEDFEADSTIPPVLIERALANGRIAQLNGGKLELAPGLERLEIEFTGLHFPAPGRLRFRTRLIGLEKDWSDSDEMRSVEYRNLQPGRYQFEVAASIGNGLWTTVPAVLEIYLAPHFWQTLWFKIGLVLFAVLAVVSFARWRERAHARQKIEQLNRTQAVQEERARIARDLHDDVGASLTQVALLSELADSDLADRPEQARELINEIFTTAKDVTRSLDEIVWAVNPAQDNLERFAAFLGNFVQGYARTAGLTSRIEIPGELPEITVSSAIRHHLYLATKEALHNVVKHAGATEIRLHLIPEPTGIRLMIEDNGIGLDNDTSGDGDGLENLRKRLDQIGGVCLYRAAVGQGTVVEMFAPLSRD